MLFLFAISETYYSEHCLKYRTATSCEDCDSIIEITYNDSEIATLNIDREKTIGAVDIACIPIESKTDQPSSLAIESVRIRPGVMDWEVSRN